MPTDEEIQTIIDQRDRLGHAQMFALTGLCRAAEVVRGHKGVERLLEVHMEEAVDVLATIRDEIGDWRDRDGEIVAEPIAECAAQVAADVAAERAEVR